MIFLIAYAIVAVFVARRIVWAATTDDPDLVEKWGKPMGLPTGIGIGLLGGAVWPLVGACYGCIKAGDWLTREFAKPHKTNWIRRIAISEPKTYRSKRKEREL